MCQASTQAFDENAAMTLAENGWLLDTPPSFRSAPFKDRPAKIDAFEGFPRRELGNES